MKNKFGEYLKELREEKGFSINQLAMKANVSNAHISRIERGLRPAPTPKIVRKIAKALGVNYETLLKIAGYLDSAKREKENIPGAMYINNYAKIPVYGKVSAGKPIFVEDNVIGYEYIPEEDVRGGDYFFMLVEGDSMINARIQEGDLVLVRRQDIIENHRIGVFLVDGEATIKRFYKKGLTVILKPENPAYEPIVTRADKIKIVGEVVEAKIKFNNINNK